MQWNNFWEAEHFLFLTRTENDTRCFLIKLIVNRYLKSAFWFFNANRRCNLKTKLKMAKENVNEHWTRSKEAHSMICWVLRGEKNCKDAIFYLTRRHCNMLNRMIERTCKMELLWRYCHVIKTRKKKRRELHRLRAVGLFSLSLFRWIFKIYGKHTETEAKIRKKNSRAFNLNPEMKYRHFRCFFSLHFFCPGLRHVFSFLKCFFFCLIFVQQNFHCIACS